MRQRLTQRTSLARLDRVFESERDEPMDAVVRRFWSARTPLRKAVRKAADPAGVVVDLAAWVREHASRVPS